MMRLVLPLAALTIFEPVSYALVGKDSEVGFFPLREVLDWRLQGGGGIFRQDTQHKHQTGLTSHSTYWIKRYQDKPNFFFQVTGMPNQLAIIEL